MNKKTSLDNPFRPGAGQKPPFLAGRNKEKKEFVKILRSKNCGENFLITGLRGVGKTVLLEELKPIAENENWTWIGSDMSSSSSANESNLANRIIADISAQTSQFPIEEIKIGFSPDHKFKFADYAFLKNVFETTPGLTIDKLKEVVKISKRILEIYKKANGLIFSYDEAQNLKDLPEKEQYPLSTLLDLFQNLQALNINCRMVLTGLPTLFPQLVEARTYAERMFEVQNLRMLTEDEAREAIIKPIENIKEDIRLTEESIKSIITLSGGYPYFIQYICREVYDVFLQNIKNRGGAGTVPIQSIQAKLDESFFAGRWDKITDRQRELLYVVSNLENAKQEFSVQDIVRNQENHNIKKFTASHINQMLNTLTKNGMVYKNRYGKYSLAIPMLDEFIKRNWQ